MAVVEPFPKGDVLLTLSGGGTVQLAGISATTFAASGSSYFA